MRRSYHALQGQNEDNDDGASDALPQVFTEADQELLLLLKSRGVPSICESISREINYSWAVTSGFRTLANVGHFYFACASQTFGYNPAHDFFAVGGMQLAVFALQKFVHNESVLLPVLECIHIYSKLHVDAAVDFLAVADAKELLMKCVRFHDNKHSIISTACQALGSLVMNDLVKESVSTPELIVELVALIKRYHSSLRICRAALVPLGFLVTDAHMATAFVASDGIALVMTAMRAFLKDGEVVWHAIGILNALHTTAVDARLIFTTHQSTGVPRLVEALATHVDTEEIAVEGFQLLARLAALPDSFRAINRCKVLDLAYVALFAYSGPQHRHTRMALKATLPAFQKCTIYDPHEFAVREQASRRDLVLYALFMAMLLLSSVWARPHEGTTAVVQQLERTLFQRGFVRRTQRTSGSSSSSSSSTSSFSFNPHTNTWTNSRNSDRPPLRASPRVTSVADVWGVLQGPLHDALFADAWPNGDRFEADGDSQLGMVRGGTSLLLGGLQLRALRVVNASCHDALAADQSHSHSPSSVACYPPYSPEVERKTAITRANGARVERWTAGDGSHFQGALARYPSSGYRVFLPRLASSSSSSSSLSSHNSSSYAACDPACQLTGLRATHWIDAATRAVLAEFTVFHAAEGVHVAVTLAFELPASGGVVVSTRCAPVYLSPYATLFLVSPRFYTELALALGVTWHTHKQVHKLLRYRVHYLVVASHVLDLAIVALWLAILVVRCQALAAVPQTLRDALLATDRDSVVSLAEPVRLAQLERTVTAWCALLMWYRLLRLARCVRPLEPTLAKFARAEALVGSFVVLATVYVLAFAHVGVLLFSTERAAFRSLAVSIASTGKALVRDWDWDRDVAILDGAILYRVLFRLCAALVMLNIVVVILRERFQNRRGSHLPPSVPDGLSVVDLAKRQLTASGLVITPKQSSPSKRLRLAASRGLERLQFATRGMLTVADDPVELTELKKVWGLRTCDDDATAAAAADAAAVADVAHHAFSLETALEAAEEQDRLLDERLRSMGARVQRVFQSLESVRQMRHTQKELGGPRRRWRRPPTK